MSRLFQLKQLSKFAQENKNNKDNEEDELMSALMDDKKKVNQIQQSSRTILHYQLPVKVGQKGQNLDEGDQPWIVGKFYPGQYLNKTHPEGHNGVDLKAAKGTPIYPIAPGKVILVANTPKGGKNVKIAHEDGQVVSYYAHLESISVGNGQEVSMSTIIGTMGETGNAKGRGAHLHYEVKVNGKNIDPLSITGKEVGSLGQKKEEIKHAENLEQYWEKFASWPNDNDNLSGVIAEIKKIAKIN